jgi:hypothetical protein
MKNAPINAVATIEKWFSGAKPFVLTIDDGSGELRRLAVASKKEAIIRAASLNITITSWSVSLLC